MKKLYLLILITTISYSCNRSTSTTTSTFKNPTIEADAVKPKTALDFAIAEAKDLKDQGWEAIPGYGGIEGILRTVVVARQELDDEGNNAKYVGQGAATGPISAQAERAASAQSASNILSQVTIYIDAALSDNNVSKSYPNNQSANMAYSKIVDYMKTRVRDYLNGAREVGLISRPSRTMTGQLEVRGYRILTINGLGDEIIASITEAAAEEEIDGLEAWADEVDESVTSKLRQRTKARHA